MTQNQKTIGVIAGILLVFVIAGFFLYRSFSTLPGEESGDILPSGQGSGLPSSVTRTEGPGGEEQSTSEPRLFQIHDRPIVGFVVFNRSGKTYARFMEQGSGHVYEYDYETKTKARISNTSIPGVQTTSWSQNGNVVAFQYLESGVVRTAVGELATSTTEGSFAKITFLPAGLGSVAVSPLGDEVAYATTRSEEGVVYIARKDGTNPRVVFSSPLTRWFLAWKNKDSLLVESPLSSLGGMAYAVSPKDGSKKLIAATSGSFAGLVPSADGVSYLFTPSWSLGTTRLDTKANTEFVAFSMNTIPEKCSFVATTTDYALCGVSGDSNAPILAQFERWLRGEGFVNDAIYAINFRKAYWSTLLTKEEAGDILFDIEHIESEFDFGAFKEKNTQSLWGLRLGPLSF